MMNALALTHLSLPNHPTLHDPAVILADGYIQKILPRTELPTTIPQQDCQGHILAAGFIDTQVNGGGGVMFNDHPNLQGIQTIQHAHYSGGTTAMLPTLITDSHAVMEQAIEAVAQGIEQLPGILGIHLEGPHLSLPKRGVHSDTHIRPFDQQTLALLDILPAHQYLLTVAPEILAAGTISMLIKRGIRVNAGHSAATYQQTCEALAEGLSGFTHLYNAMTPITGREPGVVGAALADPNSYCGIIIDHHHLHPLTAQLAIGSKATGKMLLVTDAMATVGSQHNYFELYGETIYATQGRCAKEDGTLAGSALDMATAVRNCVNDLEIPLAEALRMASLYPATFLGLEHEYGQIKPGYRADLVLLDTQLLVQQTWVAGTLCYEV